MADAWRQWEGEVVDGRYHLIKFLGGSDHSAVFVTQFGEPARKAALKFVESNSATAQLQLLRWERAAKLSHPHLLRLLHGGRCQLGRTSMLYVVTELAERNLGQILPNRPLTQSETEYMLRSVLEVLAYLHAQGLVLARLKPGNIMAVGDTMKVSSDGICAVGDKKLGHSPPSVYDPPEIASAGFSRAGDIWSLGATLVEAVTQRASAGEGIRQADPALPGSVPAPLVEIARQCLRLDPARRWTVSDIAARLLPTATAASKKPAVFQYAGWGAAAAALLLALFAGWRWSQRHSLETPAVSSVVKQAKAPVPSQPNVSASRTTPAPLSSDPVAIEKISQKPSASDPGIAPAVAVAPSASDSSAKPLPDSAKGEVVEQVVPPVPQKARDTITGKVRLTVRVSVDASGKVEDATVASPGSSHYFANLALQAAKRWKFSPPRAGGQPVPSEWSLRFAFGNKTTEVQPVQLSPAP